MLELLLGLLLKLRVSSESIRMPNLGQFAIRPLHFLLSRVGRKVQHAIALRKVSGHIVKSCVAWHRDMIESVYLFFLSYRTTKLSDPAHGTQ